MFLCTHNAPRSQMAEGFTNAWYSDQYEARSAGNEPTGVHSCAIEVMAELGIDIGSHRAKSLDQFEDQTFDYVVTLCADVQQSCPIFPGGREYLRHAFDDPVPDAVEGAPCASFRHVRDRLREWLESTFDRD
ncbi:MAG TPA: arsenate reductase ArsC [Candidatus Bathyarchaeia archaeon]|nr:arsenate reductase ArsC [Candidatus Bathyarchaeia archaeon]